MVGEGFPLEQLSARAAEALSGVEQSSARVREQPDVRTIRYYTALGLLDKPLYFQGRTAFYGERHVAQLVAIKRLQAQGLTLQEVQRRLLGRTDAELEELAGRPRPSSPPEAPKKRSFWKELPATPREAQPPPKATLSQAIKLNETVTLLLEGARPLQEEELRQIQEAAAPLLQLLEKYK